MSYKESDLSRDIENVSKIPIINTMLEVICQTTGMGFAAIARVTQDRWIACGVRDEISFGLGPGDELKIETTICNEIRGSREAVIIDYVDESDAFAHHHTPRMYGFQSYISFPIILKTGEFFGTICAIDPKPAQLNNTKTIGMFNLFADLISFHLQNIDMMERSKHAVEDLNRQLTNSIDENRQYQHISNHNLQEPLRKIRIFSDLLVKSTASNDIEKTKELALKINSSAQRFSMMIKDLSDFSELGEKESSFEVVSLTRIVTDVCEQLKPELAAKEAVVHIADLPAIKAIPLQIEQLFYHLISNAIKFSGKDTAPVINIYTKDLDGPPLSNAFSEPPLKFVEVILEDNGIGIEKSQLEKVFDIFIQLPNKSLSPGGGIGLSHCRKIVRNHKGIITARSEAGQGTSFSIIFPIA